MGLQRAAIALRDEHGDVLIEVPVVWTRVEFLSAIPDRVTLGPRPIRVFLRCPDEGVEMTRVRSAPDGIKAVISSTREITIRLAEGAPDVIAGTVEVETSARGRLPLSIPVVRYARGATHPAVLTGDNEAEPALPSK